MTLEQYLNYKVGDKVAWEMRDGNTMAGTVDDKGFDTLYLTRVDGASISLCVFSAVNVRKATPEDVLAACAFYEKNTFGMKTY